MKFPELLLVFIFSTPIILGWNDFTTRMSLDYFEENFVKILCLLSCRLDHGILYFSKTAFNKLISVSHVNIKTFDESKVNSCLKQPVTIIGVMLDVNCTGFKEVMEYASSNMLLDSNHKWLLTENDEDEGVGDNLNEIDNFHVKGNISFAAEESNEVIDFLEEIDSSVDADITVARRTGAEEYDLREVFNFGKTKGGKFVINKLGYWNSNTGLQMSKKFKYYRRWNFQNTTLRMIAVMAVFPKNFSEEMLVGRVPAPGVNMITQIGTTILNEVAKIHNIRYRYTITDRWIGTYEKNATRVVSNSLYFREQDISPILRFFKVTLDRLDMVHYVTSIEEGSHHVLQPISLILIVFLSLTTLRSAFQTTRYYYRIMSHGAGKFENKFLTPLSAYAWWCVITVSFACGVVLLLAAIIEQHPTSMQYAVFSVIASICQQFFEDVDSMRVRQPSTAGKLTILVTGIFCVLIYNYYTSSVVSWLLNGPPPSINSLWELLESPLKLAYEDVGYAKTWVKLPEYTYNKRNAKVEYEMKRRKVWNKKKGDPLMVSLNEGIELIRGGEYAYHVEVNTANKLISEKFDQKELCELGSLQSMEPTQLFAAIQKNSPYKEFYVWSMARLSERGLVSCIQKRALSPKMVCEGSSPRALALGGAAPAFILLGFGCILGFFIMMMERFVYKKKTRFIKFNLRRV